MYKLMFSGGGIVKSCGLIAALSLGVLLMTTTVFADDFALHLRFQQERSVGSGFFRSQNRNENWSAKETAFVVCDVWDAHHCLNAVRRLEEFAPRMNDVLKEARKRGATIIHSPSDCMAAYEEHGARKRAINAPAAKVRPKDVEFWCSRIPSEEKAAYPIDQSDGGEDDDPAEHAEWAAKLKSMGRNPGMPWKTQSKLIEIDADRDFISDRGEEVWNVLESRGIKNVVLVGVHLNMCVLGRPFGLRQMVRNGKNVALMRDMTDCMYNPKRWPYVDHFTGNDLVVAHVERFVCPTITSDQLLGGEPFRSKYESQVAKRLGSPSRQPHEDWTPIAVPSKWSETSAGFGTMAGPMWYRCVVRLPKNWANGETLRLRNASDEPAKVWLNGHLAKSISSANESTHQFPTESLIADDYSLLVLRIEHRNGEIGIKTPPVLVSGSQQLELKGRWQFRLGDDKSWSNIPLPAKFGGSTDILFEPK
ncbi:MAG: isochorismatase family protein [Planctomycetes bacterium]|nr:isochorismatase family protein [Planctomycetota bacterium]